MNKNLYFKICSFIIGIFIIVWSASFTLFMARQNLREKELSQNEIKPAQNSAPSASISHYTAREKDGRAMIYEVYTNGYEKLINIPDISLSELSDIDRESFEKGIFLKSKEEVASLIEDFTS